MLRHWHSYQYLTNRQVYSLVCLRSWKWHKGCRKIWCRIKTLLWPDAWRRPSRVMFSHLFMVWLKENCFTLTLINEVTFLAAGRQVRQPGTAQCFVLFSPRSRRESALKGFVFCPWFISFFLSLMCNFGSAYRLWGHPSPALSLLIRIVVELETFPMDFEQDAGYVWTSRQSITGKHSHLHLLCTI